MKTIKVYLCNESAADAMHILYGLYARCYEFVYTVPVPDACKKFGRELGWTNGDLQWADFELNVCPNTVLIRKETVAKTDILGCCYDDAVTVVVTPADNEDTVRNRIRHEMLHYAGLPADDMLVTQPVLFIPWYFRWLYSLTRTSSRYRNLWQSYYYDYLETKMECRNG